MTLTSRAKQLPRYGSVHTPPTSKQREVYKHQQREIPVLFTYSPLVM
eukprot:CAMPEP_0181296806 /NCGR_PEP_ID=MMETSP1101-20121128/4900_1 /TAXON_ID=46948 /ORGANISM="Rhodomonas abbreviata, Strain Caron Lab Isolate" /LENGTH=46 /DNA_ID= /DNA_START= /DNA_END= /DNA_ORIENTATION=